MANIRTYEAINVIKSVAINADGETIASGHVSFKIGDTGAILRCFYSKGDKHEIPFLNNRHTKYAKAPELLVKVDTKVARYARARSALSIYQATERTTKTQDLIADPVILSGDIREIVKDRILEGFEAALEAYDGPIREYKVKPNATDEAVDKAIAEETAPEERI